MPEDHIVTVVEEVCEHNATAENYQTNNPRVVSPRAPHSRFLHAIDHCVAFELVFQIYPKNLCSDFESWQLRLENPKKF
ncbi:hypothetical protein Ddc_13447 [Ditylenchus destructor]|nr:hypothetical protein Ddc_13447 [Ditylenchus destructor]